jgi:7,8-dihydropterin-6-yl-methyl-4-(beta-D-ribofuranosyl)aminobenzene 5'-phosphate synthase
VNNAGTVKIKILVDNKADVGLRAEHGFSAWVEVPGLKLLFDTGQGRALEKNAISLGVELHTADALVLSHGHYDHSGGAAWILQSAPAMRLICHPKATLVRYGIRDAVAKEIGMPSASRNAIESLPPDRLRWVTGPVQLAPGVGITGSIPRVTEYEDAGGPFFLDATGNRVDPIADDVALWLRTDRGLIVVVGCCHAGLINTLRHVQRTAGTSAIHAIVGGFHFRDASAERMQSTLGALREIDPSVIAPCHCTGDNAVQVLESEFGDRVRPGSAGATFVFGGAVIDPCSSGSRR